MDHPEIVLSGARLGASIAVGVCAAAVVVAAGAPELAPLVAWTVAATVALVWVWRIIWPQDHCGTERVAEAESGVRTTDAAVLIATVVSLGAVVLALVLTSREHGAVATVAVVMSVVAVLLSWAIANTVFALKYARHYYRDPDGGLDFKQREPPTYSDFAYVAFSVGMAFAPGEVEPTGTAIRKVALGHALLSYLFGTALLASAVNLVGGLGQS